mmetsp:Transcript_26807/g.78970  ORF Transcript_26807/g.78970 Transcript_26807/m.78970 type:complete len:275 (-) Transcript_26807:2652-3476(-)
MKMEQHSMAGLRRSVVRFFSAVAFQGCASLTASVETPSAGSSVALGMSTTTVDEVRPGSALAGCTPAGVTSPILGSSGPVPLEELVWVCPGGVSAPLRATAMSALSPEAVGYFTSGGAVSPLAGSCACELTGAGGARRGGTGGPVGGALPGTSNSSCSELRFSPFPTSCGSLSLTSSSLVPAMTPWDGCCARRTGGRGIPCSAPKMRGSMAATPACCSSSSGSSGASLWRLESSKKTSSRVDRVMIQSMSLGSPRRRRRRRTRLVGRFFCSASM